MTNRDHDRSQDQRNQDNKAAQNPGQGQRNPVQHQDKDKDNPRREQQEAQMPGHKGGQQQGGQHDRDRQQHGGGQTDRDTKRDQR